MLFWCLKKLWKPTREGFDFRMSLNFFLARRFYASAHRDVKRRASSLAIRIATAGVAVGLAVMIVSICVVKGFQREVKSKLTGFASHIEVLDYSSFASPENFPIVADKTLTDALAKVPGVMHQQSVSLKMGIMKTDETFHTIVLKGVDENYNTDFLRSQIIKGEMPAFSADSAGNDILISNTQAKTLGLDVGSRIYTYFISDKIKLRRFKVVGIYETNLTQFDEHFVWTDRAAVNKLNKWNKEQCSSVEIFADDYDNIDLVQKQLLQLIAGRMDSGGANLASLSVKENPRTASVIQWLALLDMNVWIILALMVGVAGFTMISGLLILILERTRTIGVLKALGATNTRIRHTFIMYASLIVVRGLIWGNAIALAIVFAQKYFSLVQLDPATYYVKDAPVEIDLLWIIGINLSTLIVCTLALVVPSFVISRIRPARAIRFE